MSEFVTGNIELAALSKLAAYHVEEVYYKLETLCLCFPARLTGSDALEHAIDYLYEEGKHNLTSHGNEHMLKCVSCSQETVSNIVKWQRYGNWQRSAASPFPPTERCIIEITRGEDATIGPVPHPSMRQLRILANGLSAGTEESLHDLPLVIVNSFEELHTLGNRQQLQNTIVLYDYQHFENYGQVAHYRFNGAYEAEKYGVKAVLIRTLTPDSSTSGAHTGVQRDHVKIPSVCVSIEDCEMLSRLHKRKYQLTVRDFFVPSAVLSRTLTSRNVIFEIKGKEFPDEVINIYSVRFTSMYLMLM